MTITTFQIGTTSAGLADLSALSVPVVEPRSTFKKYPIAFDLGNGQVKGAGYPVATWTWDFITDAQRDKLKTYCTGKSAAVYISTKDDSLAYKAYSAIMVWPEIEEHFATRRLDFVIEFRHLVEVT